MAFALRWGKALGMMAVLPLMTAGASFAQVDTDTQMTTGQIANGQVTEGFSGQYAPSEWRFVNIQTRGEAFLRDEEGDLFGFEDSSDLECPTQNDVTPGRAFFIGSSTGFGADIDSLPASALFVRGGNQSACAAGITDVFITVPEDSLLSFNWFYRTDDISPFFDPFGYTIASVDEQGAITDPVFFPLVDSMGEIAQTGIAEIRVKAQDIFAFEIITLDNLGGSASVVINQFKATPLIRPVSVPEPTSTIAIFISGLGVLGLCRRHGQR